jgi:hypothetical protein
MKLFKFYKRRIENRITELRAERSHLLAQQKAIILSLKPREHISISLKIDELNDTIDELENLLK